MKCVKYLTKLLIRKKEKINYFSTRRI